MSMKEKSLSTITMENDVSDTIDASYYKGHGTRAGVERPYVIEGVDVYNGAMTGDVSSALTAACGMPNTSGGKVLQGKLYSIDKKYVLENHPQDSRIKIKDDGVFQTMGARQGGEKEPHTLMIIEDMEARRLTPLECTRLQGFPDGWVDIGEWTDSKGKVHKDSDGPKYKALGNSIALPFWQWLANRIVARLKEDGVENPTMCSLFDGIGGFPLVFQNAGCRPIWASEIEEFPIAVTKHHFPEEGDENGRK